MSWERAEARHVPRLIAQLGAERRAELISICEQASIAPEDMIMQALGNSRETFCYVDDDGEPVTIIGCIPAEGGAVIWMIGVEARIENHKRFFLTESKRWIAEASALYGILWSNVAKTEKKSLRWMDWMGFRCVGEIAAFGREAWQLERSL